MRIFIFLLLILATLGQSPIGARDLEFAPAPADNPLKGFMPYEGNYDFPHSMEWFYLPLRDLQRDTDQFDWSALDAKLDAIAARGHQAVFRIHLDYPQTPSGIPAFLSHVPTRAYTDYGNDADVTRISVAPDYENPDLRRALRRFIAALGARYDGDPRIGFLTVGLLGFWGEWHTYPHDDWMASTAVQNEVLDAYAAAFSRTRLLLRYPQEGIGIEKRALGFHDDSFAYQTMGPDDWHFWPRMRKANLTEIWRTQPIGGEVRPEVQDCIWNDPPAENCVPLGQEFDRCVSTTHASWMLNHGAFDDKLTPQQRERAINAARSLGYELWVSQATLSQRERRLRVEITLQNRGVAPFYYDWPLELAALDADGKIVARWTTDWRLSRVLPDAPQNWSFESPSPLPKAAVELVMRARQPLKQGRPLRFANSAQDRHIAGWLSLGKVSTP